MIFRGLIGKTILRIDGMEKGSDEIIFSCANDIKYRMIPDVSPTTVGFEVLLEDIVGDPADLTGRPVVMAMVTSNKRTGDDIAGSETWTFYSISTNYGTVVLRWYGNSNGNYSEAVTFERIPDSELAGYL